MNENKLYELIFFITDRCNSRCGHCFNKDNLNRSIDLSLVEIENIAKNLPQIDNLLLSGGEPFLRDDLPELVELFKRHNKIKTVSIPTNGIASERILNSAERLAASTDLAISINLSLDGFAGFHDQIRGVPGNFDLSMKTLSGLSSLRSKYKKLSVLVNSVIVSGNYQELPALALELKSKGWADNHFFEIVRFVSNEEKKFDLEWGFYEKALALQYDYFKKRLTARNPLKSFWKKVRFLGKFGLIYQVQFDNFNKKTAWPVSCSAGKNIAVVDSKGKLSACELRHAKFELDEVGENSSCEKWQTEINAIACKQCFCTHVCFIDASIEASAFARFILIPLKGLKNYFRYEIVNRNSSL